MAAMGTRESILLNISIAISVAIALLKGRRRSKCVRSGRIFLGLLGRERGNFRSRRRTRRSFNFHGESHVSLCDRWESVFTVVEVSQPPDSFQFVTSSFKYLSEQRTQSDMMVSAILFLLSLLATATATSSRVPRYITWNIYPTISTS